MTVVVVVIVVVGYRLLWWCWRSGLLGQGRVLRRSDRDTTIASDIRQHSPRNNNAFCTVYRGKKRILLIVGILSIIAFVSNSAHSLGKCASLRTIRGYTGDRVSLCANGMSVRNRLPSHLFVAKSLSRFMGDTFYFEDMMTIPHLDWRTAVLESRQCLDLQANAVRMQQTQQSEQQQCTAIHDEAVSIGPNPEKWDTSNIATTRGDMKDDFSLPAFRVSNELQHPNTIEQSALITQQLNECHIDSSSHMLLEALDSSSSTSLELVRDTTHGVDIAIVLSASNFAERNVYHILHMESGLWCLFLALQNAAESLGKGRATPTIHLILPMQWSNPTGTAVARALASAHGAELLIFEQNSTFIEQQLYLKLYHVHGPFFGGVSDLLRAGTIGFNWPLWDSFKFEMHRLASPFGVMYSETVRRGNKIQLLKQQLDVTNSSPMSGVEDTGHVLIVQRRGDRRLVGSRNGSFVEVVDAICNLGIPVKVIEFEDLSAEQQIQSAQSANVLVAAHGAALSHAAWMKPGGAIVEVLMRQGFVEFGDYHKADYANLARFFGLKYVYYDPLELLPKEDLISSKLIVVDTDELARVVFCLYRSTVQT
eukprot:scaffold4215_cov202-Alexandrium_tamarense.AAC.4